MAQRIPLAPGAFAGDYEIIRLLSEFGGSALVYYARRNDRLYVLKELYPAGWARRIDRDDSGTLVLTRIREQDWANHLQQFEAEAVNYTLLQREFGRDITFWGGGCDTRSILNRATPQEVRDHVRRMVDIFAPGGGFVFNTVHNIMPDCPPENIDAMFSVLHNQ